MWAIHMIVHAYVVCALGSQCESMVRLVLKSNELLREEQCLIQIQAKNYLQWYYSSIGG
jgi:hypothetical protein